MSNKQKLGPGGNRDDGEDEYLDNEADSQNENDFYIKPNAPKLKKQKKELKVHLLIITLLADCEG